MTLDQIRAFITVRETGSLMKASEQLYISPSTLSYHLKTLEEEIGITLFDRSSRNLELTPTGSVLAGKLKEGIRQINLAIKEAQEKEKRIIHFSIALSIRYTYQRLGAATDALLRKHPETQVHYISIHVDNPMLPLICGEADVLITFKEDAEVLEDSVYYPVETTSFYAVANREIAKHFGKTVTLKEVGQYPVFLVGSHKSHLVHKRLQQMISEIVPTARFIHNDRSAQETLPRAANGEGVLVINAAYAELLKNRTDVSITRIEDFSTDIVVCCMKNRLSDLVTDFASFLKNA